MAASSPITITNRGLLKDAVELMDAALRVMIKKAFSSEVVQAVRYPRDSENSLRNLMKTEWNVPI